jgi:hypothetical protein
MVKEDPWMRVAYHDEGLMSDLRSGLTGRLLVE